MCTNPHKLTYTQTRTHSHSLSVPRAHTHTHIQTHMGVRTEKVWGGKGKKNLNSERERDLERDTVRVANRCGTRGQQFRHVDARFFLTWQFILFHPVHLSPYKSRQSWASTYIYHWKDAMHRWKSILTTVCVNCSGRLLPPPKSHFLWSLRFRVHCAWNELRGVTWQIHSGDGNWTFALLWWTPQITLFSF